MATGRPPSVMLPATIQRLLACVRGGANLGQAARLVGVRPQAVRHHRSSHPEFAQALERAQAEFELEAIAQIERGHDWLAAALLLDRRHADVAGWPQVAARIANLTQEATA